MALAVLNHWGFSDCVIWTQKTESGEAIIKLPASKREKRKELAQQEKICIPQGSS